jgi:hypothetical protein
MLDITTLIKEDTESITLYLKNIKIQNVKIIKEDQRYFINTKYNIRLEDILKIEI